MSIKNRLAQLEKIHAPTDRKILVVIYDPETGRATAESTAEIIGMTREEITALCTGNTTLLNVVYGGAVYIPDNHRSEVPK